MSGNAQKPISGAWYKGDGTVINVADLLEVQQAAVVNAALAAANAASAASTAGDNAADAASLITAAINTLTAQAATENGQASALLALAQAVQVLQGFESSNSGLLTSILDAMGGMGGDVDLSTIETALGVINAALAGTITVAGAVTALVSGAVSVSNFPAAPVDQLIHGPVSVSNFPAAPADQLVHATALDVLLSTRATEATLETRSSEATLATRATEATLLLVLAQLALIKAKTDNIDVLLSTRTKPADVQTTTEAAADLCISATAAAGSAVTCTLPLVAGKSHYITLVQIEAYAINNVAGIATPNVITTTNLTGSPTFNIDTLLTKGQTVQRQIAPTKPIKSQAAATATTFVCPAVANVIWNVTVWYRAD